MNRTVVAVAYDGLCSFEFGVATELFGLPRPELGVDLYDFEVVAVEPPPIRILGGVELSASTNLESIVGAGTVVLPGWRDIEETPPGDLIDALVAAHRSGARIMSICSGVFVLAATGLLDGLEATTHWRYTQRLVDKFPAIRVRPDVLFVDNGSTLTSAGSAAGIDLGLHLIRRDYGVEIANRVARRLVVPPVRDGGQAQFIDTRVSERVGTSLAPTVAWALENLPSVITVEDLADHAAMAPRTLARRFQREMGIPPHRWLTRQRLSLAQRLLETSDRSIELVAHDSGFGSAATLRHHFRAEIHTTPSAYRERFRVDRPEPNAQR